MLITSKTNENSLNLQILTTSSRHLWVDLSYDILDDTLIEDLRDVAQENRCEVSSSLIDGYPTVTTSEE